MSPLWPMLYVGLVMIALPVLFTLPWLKQDKGEG